MTLPGPLLSPGRFASFVALAAFSVPTLLSSDLGSPSPSSVCPISPDVQGPGPTFGLPISDQGRSFTLRCPPSSYRPKSPLLRLLLRFETWRPPVTLSTSKLAPIQPKTLPQPRAHAPHRNPPLQCLHPYLVQAQRTDPALHHNRKGSKGQLLAAPLLPRTT